MDLKESLLAGIRACGLKKPSSIQQKVMIAFISGRNTVVEAPSGVDRIASFLIPILQNIDNVLSECQAIVVAPTHKMAKEIFDFLISLSEFMYVKSVICIGGTNLQKDVQMFTRSVHIVVGTTGRIVDLIQKKVLKTSHVKFIVINGFNEIFKHEFQEKMIVIKKVFEKCPDEAQIIALSETMTTELCDWCKTLLNDPNFIQC